MNKFPTCRTKGYLILIYNNTKNIQSVGVLGREVPGLQWELIRLTKLLFMFCHPELFAQVSFTFMLK